MARPYPLYDELLKRVNETTDKALDIRKLCNTINGIGQTHASDQVVEHYREIAALILHHEVLTTGSLSSVPFDGKLMFGGKGLVYQIMNLPPMLQLIIGKYIEDPNPLIR